MKTISSIPISDSAILSKLLRYLDKEIVHLQEVLKDQPVITDGGRDVTDNLKGKRDAYTNIRFFVERGCEHD